jgi:hypothetical protein
MNSRIRELAQQAFDTAEYPADQQYRIEPNSAFCKKFAELIVRECVDVVSKATASPNGYQALVKHFGVER